MSDLYPTANADSNADTLAKRDFYTGSNRDAGGGYTDAGTHTVLDGGRGPG